MLHKDLKEAAIRYSLTIGFFRSSMKTMMRKEEVKITKIAINSESSLPQTPLLDNLLSLLVGRLLLHTYFSRTLSYLNLLSFD